MDKAENFFQGLKRYRAIMGALIGLFFGVFASGAGSVPELLLYGAFGAFIGWFLFARTFLGLLFVGLVSALGVYIAVILCLAFLSYLAFIVAVRLIPILA